jgi:hypothetical protein
VNVTRKMRVPHENVPGLGYFLFSRRVIGGSFDRPDVRGDHPDGGSRAPPRLARCAVYVTPIVFHFAVVFIVSVVSVVPGMSPTVVAVILGSCAIAGLAYSVVTTIRLCGSGWEDPIPDWSDKSFYGFLPTIIYVALGGAAAAVPLLAGKAVFVIGAIMLVLLLLGIRNAWDLATTLAQNAPERHQ